MTLLTHSVSIPLSASLFSGVVPAHASVRFDPARAAWVLAADPGAASTPGDAASGLLRPVERRRWRVACMGLLGSLLGLVVGGVIYAVAPSVGLAVDVPEPFPVDTGQVERPGSKAVPVRPRDDGATHPT